MGFQGGTLTCKLKALRIVNRHQVWQWWFSVTSPQTFYKKPKEPGMETCDCHPVVIIYLYFNK